MTSVSTSTPSRTQEQAVCIAQAALEKQGGDVMVLEVGGLTSIADYFVLASGESERQVRAIATFIEKEMSDRFQAQPQIEGKNTAKWILLDFGAIIVHIFKSDIRQYYALEKMWADAPQIDVPEPKGPIAKTPRALGTMPPASRVVPSPL